MEDPAPASQRQRLSHHPDVGRQLDPALEERRQGVGTFELTPANQPPVDEAQIRREDLAHGVPVTRVVDADEAVEQLARGRRRVRRAFPPAQFLEAGQRGRLITVVEQLIAQRPTVADPSDHDVDVLQRTTPVGGVAVGAEA